MPTRSIPISETGYPIALRQSHLDLHRSLDRAGPCWLVSGPNQSEPGRVSLPRLTSLGAACVPAWSRSRHGGLIQVNAGPRAKAQDIAHFMIRSTTSSGSAPTGGPNADQPQCHPGHPAHAHRQARRDPGRLRCQEDRVGHPACGPGQRRLWRPGGRAAHRPGGQGPEPPLPWGACPADRGHPGRGGADPNRGQPLRYGAGLHRLPRTAQDPEGRPPHPGGRGRIHRTSTSTAPTGGSPPMPTRATPWAD